MRSPILQSIAIIAFLVVAAISLQALRGAYTSGFGTYPDEPAHYVTGLLVRDYLADGLSQHPMRFAENYYTHYPRVALGQWPPTFYAIQAGWTLPFGASRVSVITLMATLSALLAALLFFAGRQIYGAPIALASAVLLLSLPLVQEYSGAIMTEIPLALMCFAAMFAFGKFLDTGAARHCLLFGLFSVAAILTKGDGLALALVPPVAILISRRWSLLRQPVLWATGAVIGLVTAPWYVLTLDRVRDTWTGTSGTALGYAQEAVPFYLVTLFGMGGIFVAAFALAGLVKTLFSPARSSVGAAAIGLLAGAITVHGFVPSGTEARHMVMAAPALMLLFGIGLQLLLAPLGRLPRKVVLPGLATGVVLLMAIHVTGAPRKAWLGYEQLATSITTDPALDSRAILVSSESVVDGILIAETAMRDARPNRIMLRADRILSQSGWQGEDYILRYHDAESVLRVLDAVPVALVIVDSSIPTGDARPHHELLRTALVQAGSDWRLETTIDVVRKGIPRAAGLEVYRRTGDVPPAVVKFHHVFGDSPQPFIADKDQ